MYFGPLALSAQKLRFPCLADCLQKSKRKFHDWVRQRMYADESLGLESRKYYGIEFRCFSCKCDVHCATPLRPLGRPSSLILQPSGVINRFSIEIRVVKFGSLISPFTFYYLYHSKFYFFVGTNFRWRFRE